MRRMLVAMTVALFVGSVALGHALYFVPEGEKLVIVFGHDLEPDTKVKLTSWERMANMKVLARDEAMKATEVTWKMGEGCLTATIPAGTKVVSTVAEYGVSSRGGNPPRRVRFAPKAVIGANVEPRLVTLGADCPLEIIPEVEAGKVRFRVLAKNKFVAKAEVEVMVPEKEEDVTVTTDEQGLTSAFDAKGRYGVTVRQEAKTSGEVGGMKYDSEVTVATLVVRVK